MLRPRVPVGWWLIARILRVAPFAVLLVVVSATVAYEPTPDEEIPTVQSSDGRLSLQIPEAALPDGVTPSSITVTLSSDDADAQEGVFIYELEPDGLEFTESVEMTLNLPIESQAVAIPLMFLIDGDSVEALTDPVVDFDRDMATAVIKVRIGHFSRLVVFGRFGLFDLEMTDVSGSKYPVGRGPTLDVTVGSQRDWGTSGQGTVGGAIIMSLQTWTLRGDMSTAGPAGPTSLDLPRFRSFKGGDLYQGQAQIICVNPGTAVSSYTVDIVYSLIEFIHIGGGRGEEDVKRGNRHDNLKTFATIGSGLFECVSPPTPTAPVPTSTSIVPTATSVPPTATSPGPTATSVPPTPTPALTTEPTTPIPTVTAPAGGIPIDVLEIGDLRYPSSQIYLSSKHVRDANCTEHHWHALIGFPPYSLERPDQSIEDPNPDGCGFGTFEDLPRQQIQVSRDVLEAFCSGHDRVTPSNRSTRTRQECQEALR